MYPLGTFVALVLVLAAGAEARRLQVMQFNPSGSDSGCFWFTVH